MRIAHPPIMAPRRPPGIPGPGARAGRRNTPERKEPV
ncbi:hypothetical protein SFR_3528 [Streptomyces sp. FR-008]|nr:hypothetical protein SFR_3528 [Streptomyces sp. FR-008]